MSTLAATDLEAHIKNAMTHHRQGQLAQARAMYSDILAMQPEHPQVIHLMGVLALQNKDYGEAIDQIEHAIQLQPQEASYHLNLGVAYKACQHYDASLTCFERAIALAPQLAAAHFNHAVVLHALNRLEEAIASYERAIALEPTQVEYHANLGSSLQVSNRLDAAIHSYDQALALNPHHASTLWNKSLALLLKGSFDEGWTGFESRWQRHNFTSEKRAFTAPLWLGQTSLVDQRILLHGEQGLGDFLQFCRYTSSVAALGAHVILETPASLHALLQNLEGVHELVIAGNPLPEFDYHCPLLSLPLAFKTNEYTVPALPQPLWTRKGTQLPQQRPRIGIVWRGNAQHKNDAHRSMPLEVLLSALPSELSYFSLQKDVTDTEKASMQALPHVHDMSAAMHDFADTAALCEEMDIIISVDTSVAHLSASLNRPTWLLLAHHPDWRWMLQRTDSPWYPSVKLYRQTERQNWQAVCDALTHDLYAFKNSQSSL